jgi:predicted Zn finger-like uncharacterized protein
MRIACPSCAAAYDVPDSLVPAGRGVRCARCGSDWTPVQATAPAPDLPPPASEASPLPSSVPETAEARGVSAAAAEPEPAPRLSAMDRLAAHPAWPRSRLRLRLAWAASLLLLALAGWSGYAWRFQIIEVWPPSARMYAAFGVHPATSSTR